MGGERGSAWAPPARPGAPAMGTPPRTNCRVGSKAWTSNPIPTRISAGLPRHGRPRRGQERLAQLDVARAGDLHVADAAGDHPDAVAGPGGHLRAVVAGDPVGNRLLDGGLDAVPAKCLGRLGAPEARPAAEAEHGASVAHLLDGLVE